MVTEAFALSAVHAESATVDRRPLSEDPSFSLQRHPVAKRVVRDTGRRMALVAELHDLVVCVDASMETDYCLGSASRGVAGVVYGACRAGVVGGIGDGARGSCCCSHAGVS
jgi:hypothetical protein